MSARSIGLRRLRLALLLLGSCGLLFQTTTGCSTAVRTTILTGLEQFASALVTAGFQSITPTTSSTSTST